MICLFEISGLYDTCMPGDVSLIYCLSVIIIPVPGINVLKLRCISLEDLLEGKNSQGMTPLFQAVSCNNLECVQYLVTSGSNIDTRDNVGRTPVALAAYQVHLMLVTITNHYHYKMYMNSMSWLSVALFCFVFFLC